MNSTGNKSEIKNVLKQIFKELKIPSDKFNSIITSIYNNLYDYDASKFINKLDYFVSTQKIIDIFNKNNIIVKNSITKIINTFFYLNIISTSFTDIQLTGLCIFVHLVLQGARGSIEGFGLGRDLIQFEKDIQRKMKNEAQKILAKQMSNSESERTLRKLNYFNNEDEDEEEEEKEDEEVTCLVSNTIDSWEDLA